MTLTRFKDLTRGTLEPVVETLADTEITPNQISITALILAALAATVIYQDLTATYIAAGLLIAISGLLDVVDGELARHRDQASRRGDYLDHVLDRYSDLIILLGVTAAMDAWLLGILAMTGVYLTSYMGTQAQAIGVSRTYGGLMGRADRMTLFVMGCILHPFVPALFGYRLLEVVLIITAVLGNITAIQRFISTYRSLN